MSIFNRKGKKSETTSTTAEKVTGTTLSKEVASKVLLRPVITEKQTLNGTYAFEVAPGATKSEVMKAVEAVFGEAPISVRIINVIGKTIRSRKGEGHRKDWKKAIVRLPKGKTINVYAGI